MKRYFFVGLMILFYFILTGCASRNPAINFDLTNETWLHEVHTSPYSWVRGADSWFLTGDPTWAEVANERAPASAAISTMMVNVPRFYNIAIDGDFQVQIFGTYGKDSVYVYGPNAALREVVVGMRGNTLCINQTKKAPYSVRQVIVRIGINQLFNLMRQGGCGTVEGKWLRSTGLNVIAGPRSTGNMYLGGDMSLRSVNNEGFGVISIFGANTPSVNIRTARRGGVNVSGRVGIRSIVHQGGNDINIVGAVPTVGTRIDADGIGKVGIYGNVNLTNVVAKNRTHVYAYRVTSQYIYAYVYNHARIGLAGYTDNLFVDTADQGQFEGRYLCATNAYARARGYSHINVAATSKVFTSATQSGSIYFFGSPELMSQFVGTNGVVMPIWTSSGNNCTLVPIRHDYKGELSQQAAMVPMYRPEPLREPISYVYEKNVKVAKTETGTSTKTYASEPRSITPHETQEVPYQSKYEKKLASKQTQTKTQAVYHIKGTP